MARLREACELESFMLHVLLRRSDERSSVAPILRRQLGGAAGQRPTARPSLLTREGRRRAEQLFCLFPNDNFLCLCNQRVRISSEITSGVMCD